MPWNLRRDFHIDINASYGRFLMVSATDSALLQPPPDMVAGDGMPVRLHFYERGVNGAITLADPGPNTDLIFSGRPANVPVGSDLLFETNDFVEIETGIWEGTLDLTPQEFSTHLATAPAGPKIILGEIELRDSVSNARRVSFQFDLTARPQVYANQDTPAALPTPEAWLAAQLEIQLAELGIGNPPLALTEPPTQGVIGIPGAWDLGVGDMADLVISEDTEVLLSVTDYLGDHDFGIIFAEGPQPDAETISVMIRDALLSNAHLAANYNITASFDFVRIAQKVGRTDPAFSLGISFMSGDGDITAGFGTPSPLGSPGTTAVVGTAGALGQLAIFTLDGVRKYSFRCIATAPMTWEAATPGLLFNPTLNAWRRTLLSGAEGSEVVSTDSL